MATRAVGILANALGDPYSLRLMQSIAGELTHAGCHAICFMGGFPHSPLFRDANDRPALPSTVDAWVLLSAALPVSTTELGALARTTRTCVSVGLELAEVPSLTASDEAGVFQAVAHLARRHERRRIAFVAGPTTSVDACRRLAAYRMALESVGLPLDPALVASGDYEPRAGREAVRTLERQAKKYDAVVAANDLMAIGVIEGLRASGKRVPEDVSVIGFDDMEEASFSSPTLTTVRQPLQEVGASAARIALQSLSGAHVEPHSVVTAPLVIRESCGCRNGGSEVVERAPQGAGVGLGTKGLRENALRDLVRRELSSSRTSRELGNLGEALLGATDQPELAQPLTEICRLLKLRRFALATFSGGQRHARVTLESSGPSVVFHQQPQSFGLDRVLPPGYLQDDGPTQLVLAALELAGEQFGFLVLEGDLRNTQAYLELRRTLSSALARVAQSRELRRLYTADKKKG
jgi:LacI family transcriptional regulator